ncbi:MAG: RagB/SusD family nutrient uptake outer membrane protein [Bacteroidales bacterium]|nr:RagB/SusD family nutrient uptake outer membrane protein [Bacteroidales bacterium]
MKKYILNTILILTIFCFNSCEDFLNLSPVSELTTASFYNNDNEVEGGVLAIYDAMQNYVSVEWALTEMRSDNTNTRAHRSEGEWREFETMNVQTINATVSDYWINNYNAIFRANTVLENLGNVSSAYLKTQFEGEAKFARALSHFNLVRAFGDVPVVDKIINYNDEDYFLRDPQSEVYSFIESDLLTAIDNLPGRSDIEEGRATIGAAKAILAKVYLTMKEHSKAKTLLDDLILDVDYGLLTNFNDVFYQELNKEIIFGVQFIPDDSKDSQKFSYQFTNSGLNYPTEDLMSIVDTSDLREPTLFFWNDLSGATGDFEPGKFQPETRSQLQGNDWIVIRFADVLLMHAEAIMADAGSTTDQSALDSFNKIRIRAGMGTVTTLTKDLLLTERRIELCHENHRLYDLIRFGVAETVMSAFSLTQEPGFEFKSTALLLPIPMREINIYPQLEQNSGYN